MRPSLLEHLRCPECRSALTLADAWKREGDDIGEGGLACGACGQRYPIIGGVPRLLPAALASLVERRHPEFFSAHPEYARGGSARSHEIRRTAESFGYLWRVHPEPSPLSRDYWEGFNRRFPPDFFQGKLLLEAGCGNGRYARHYAEAGAEVVALDLSEAAEVAQGLSRGLPNLQVIQGDLQHPPFPDEHFDFVNCFGVLHHLPRPRLAFQRLLALVHREGWMQGYVYKSFRDENRVKYAVLRALAGVRLVTTRLPHEVLSAALWGAVPAYLALVGGPNAALRRLGLGRVARAWPFFQQHAITDPRHAHELLLDRFSTPIEHRFTRDELWRWFTEAGLAEVEILSAGGWVGSGRKPRAAAALPVEPAQGGESPRRLTVVP